MSTWRPRLEAVVASVASALSEDERVEVRGLIAAGEARLGLEQLIRFLLDRDAVVEGWVPDELRALAVAWCSEERGLELLRVHPLAR